MINFSVCNPLQVAILITNHLELSFTGFLFSNWYTSNSEKAVILLWSYGISMFMLLVKKNKIQTHWTEQILEKEYYWEFKKNNTKYILVYCNLLKFKMIWISYIWCRSVKFFGSKRQETREFWIFIWLPVLFFFFFYESKCPFVIKFPNDGSFHNPGGKYMVVSESAELAYKNRNELSESFFILSLFKRPSQSKLKRR